MIRIILPGTVERHAPRILAQLESLRRLPCCSWSALGSARYPWAAGGAAAALFFGIALIDEAVAWRVYRVFAQFESGRKRHRPSDSAPYLRLCFFIIRAAALAGRPDMRLTPAKPCQGWSLPALPFPGSVMKISSLPRPGRLARTGEDNIADGQPIRPRLGARLAPLSGLAPLGRPRGREGDGG